nr:LOW QUALITY PROTEIN: beta-1,3-galactosyltransferase 2-like [Cherax quadricarinatus]
MGYSVGTNGGAISGDPWWGTQWEPMVWPSVETHCGAISGDPWWGTQWGPMVGPSAGTHGGVLSGDPWWGHQWGPMVGPSVGTNGGAIIGDPWWGRQWGPMVGYYQYIRMRVIFVFGAAKSADEQKKINEESDTYRDIIQLDFVDSYKNLSYKGVGALQWISEHCMHARWILKSDDDIVINVFSLVAFLKYYAAWETSANGAPPSKLLCAVWWGMPVLRGTGCSKWCVSMDEFPNSTFPTYCSGCAFVIPTYLAPRLYNAFFRVRFLWVDDAFISGVMAKAAGISHQPLHSLYELNHHLIEKNMIYGNRLFCHHPGAAGARAKWWPRIVLKETRHLPNSSEEVYS